MSPKLENLKMYKPSKWNNTFLEEYNDDITVTIKENCFSLSDNPCAFFKMNSTKLVKRKFKNNGFIYLLRDRYKEVEPIYIKLNFFQYIKFNLMQFLL